MTKAVQLEYAVDTISTYSEFKKSWRRARNNIATRQTILLNLNHSVIFKDSCEPLDEICDSLASIDMDQSSKIRAILTSLQKAREFSLATAFLSAKSKAILELLIEQHLN